MPGAPPPLTDRFLAAVALASEVHGAQAIAAMLHDAVEDGGGRPMLARIGEEFGERVAAIVEACSDNLDSGDERPWRERKDDYLDHLPTIEDDAVLRVVLADKVHNARSIVRDYRKEGSTLWERFKPRTVEDQLWYYGGLLEFFGARSDGPLVEDLRRAVAELRALAAADPQRRGAGVSA